MKEKALKTLQRITSLFDEAFRDLGDAPGMARVKANLFVNTWQGAIVVARAGEGLEHIGRFFRYLKEIVPLLLIQECWSQLDSSWSLSYSENGAPATRSAKFGGVNPSTYRVPKSRRMLSIAVIGF